MIATETTIKRETLRIVDVVQSAFVAVGPDGEPDHFTNEEVHVAERNLIKVGAEFTLHHLYRVNEWGAKTKAQRVEFTSPWPPVWAFEAAEDPCAKDPCRWCRSGGRSS